MRQKSIASEVSEANETLSTYNVQIEARDVLRFFVVLDDGSELEREFASVNDALMAARRIRRRRRPAG